MNERSYCVNHTASQTSVRWGLTEENATVVLAELGSDEHSVSYSLPLMGWARPRESGPEGGS